MSVENAARPATPPAADQSARQSAVIALLVAGALFMEQLDGTVIATALPQIAQSFGVAAVDLNIGMSAYLLTVAVFIPASGWVADRFGARVVFASAIVAFTLASVVCAASGTLWQFTVARVLQGAGGAMMVPVGRLIVLRNTEKQDLVRMIAYLTWPALTAPVIGPPLGGLITTYSSWPWIFLLNVPLGLIGLALAQILIPNTRGEAAANVRLAGLCAHRVRELQPDVQRLKRSGAAAPIGASPPRCWCERGGRNLRGPPCPRPRPPAPRSHAVRVPSFAITVSGGLRSAPPSARRRSCCR